MFHYCYGDFSDLYLDCKKDETSLLEVSNWMDLIHGFAGGDSLNNEVNEWVI